VACSCSHPRLATAPHAGNGAPDVFTAFAALNDQSDVNMLVGGVLGASMFTTTITLAAVIWRMPLDAYS
jgi:Ca2+/Na+ antiporter